MRGMMKWQPFKSLSGQYKILEEHKKQKEKIDKPELSDDEIEDINSLLVALTRGDRVDVTYYDDGLICTVTDYFINCDSIEQRVIFRRKSVPFNVLLGLKRAN